ncbi:MAG: hypothetical protein RL414_75 [Actinomycetota bacterium]
MQKKSVSEIPNLLRDLRAQADERLLAIAAVLIFAFAISYAAPVAQRTSTSQSAFPASVCPAKIGDATTTAFLPKSKILVRHVAAKSLKFYKAPAGTEAITSNSLLIDSNPGTTFALNNSANGLGAVICQSGSADQWFVGGSGGLTSKGTLDIVNSGLSDATVDITPYSSKQELPVVTLKIPANSDRQLLVDALVPGDESVALHVVTRAGRVTSFLFDQRKKGLRSLGSDYVNSISSAATTLVIPTVLQSSSGKVSTTLRMLVPGNFDASVKITINSGDGSFTPVGFDQKSVPHGRVVDYSLADLTSTTPMSVIVESDQPVVASVLSQMSGNDFAWAIPVKALNKLNRLQMNFTGLSPTFVFTGADINVSLSWKNAAGKSKSGRVTGRDIAFWNPGKGGLRTITFVGNKPVYAGAIIRTAAGWRFAYLPLTPSAVLEQSTLPIVDVRSLSRG